MKILLVYPETSSTFWSFEDALRFILKKSAEPLLGLLTIAAMLPEDRDKRLIDINTSPLKNENIHRADSQFLTGMKIPTKILLKK